MSNISPRHFAGSLVFMAVLMLIALGGFGRMPLTDASWSAEQTVTGSYRSLQMAGEIKNPKCRSGMNSGNEKPIILSWDKPAQLRDVNVIYDIAWHDHNLTSYSGTTTVDEPVFGPFFPGPEFTSQHADLTFTIRARLADSEWQSEPTTIDAHGPIGGGVLHCGTSPRR